jgi:predicted LPLAT superfamily acyltransferase
MYTRLPSILNTTSAPTDPIERIIWLDGVMKKAKAELEDEYAAAYFEARLLGEFETAVRLGTMTMKRALALTRRQNEKTGRSVRWNDGLDRTSTQYTG